MSAGTRRVLHDYLTNKQVHDLGRREDDDFLRMETVEVAKREEQANLLRKDCNYELVRMQER